MLHLGMALGGELRHILPYFLLGVGIGAVIRTYRLHVRMRDSLGRFGAYAIPAAVLIGVISPLCSCGSIPLFVSLVSSGVPLAPALTLLLISPLMSPSGYTITAWELGPAWANLKLFSALFMGAFAGGVTFLLERNGFFGNPGVLRISGVVDIHASDCPGELACTCGDQWSNRLAHRGHGKPVLFLAKAWELTLKTGKFTLLGVVLGVLAERHIPREWIAGYLGEGSARNVLLVTIFSVPLHVNEITAAAILYSLLELGLAKGPALAFLIGGPVTSIPAMSVLFAMCRKRVVATFLAICLAGTLLLALTFQFLVNRYPAVNLLFEYAK
ncbi:MAG: permease [Deltaproteobacteria bacterium]|nr:permease [Deltaproteobacteria bacterium]